MLSLALALVGLEAAAECVGCHTPARDEPPARFEVGLGKWKEASCFGCHREITAVARAGVLDGMKDERFLALPLTAEGRVRVANAPLSFLSAPEDIGLAVGGVARIDGRGLLEFLRRPVDVRRAPGEADGMLAYPRLQWGDVPEVMGAASGAMASTGVCAAGASLPLPSPAAPSDVDGAALFDERCRPCHASVASPSGRPSAYLALFTPQWIHAYANGLVERPGGGPRTMPVIALDRAAAAAIRRYAAAARDAQAAAVDARVAAVVREDLPDAQRRTRQRPLTDEDRAFVWGDFLREGKCVHCHGAEGHRAAARFFASPKGLARWVGEHGGLALWRRLTIREIERAAGMTAQEPGMPMASDPLPVTTRDRIFVWAREGCPTPSGRRTCAPAPAQ